MSRNFFNGTDSQLQAGANNFASKVSADPTVVGLTQQEADDLMALNMIWQAAYVAAVDPETRTRGKVEAKRSAARNIRAMLSDLSKIINGTPSVTDAQKIDLGLGIPKPRAPIPAPTVRPGMDVVSVQGRSVDVLIHDSTSSAKRGKPAGATAAWIYWFAGETYPTDLAQWHFEGATTKAKHTLRFPDELPAGQQVWIRAAWANAKQEMGPLCEPITTTLQGGGTASSQPMKIAA